MPRLLASVLGRDRATEAHFGSNRHAAQWAVIAVAYACGTWLAKSVPMRRLALRLALVLLLAFALLAAAAADARAVVGTWRGTAEEFSSPHIQGRAQVTVDIMPDGRWTSVWRQAGRERRSAGTWHLTRELIVFETDSAEPLPPRLSLRHRGDAFYGTALTPLPEGRATTVTISLSPVAPPPVASRPGL
jgi:hypothetical protein